MTRIAHLSDPHFGSEEPGLADSLWRHLETGGYDLVAVSGDLTMAARNREFLAARRFLDSLSADTLAVPGNHDVTPYKLTERFLRPWRRWRRHVSADLEPEWSRPDVVVVGVNTARRALLSLDWSQGSISRRQIARLARRFRPLPDHVFRIVVAHHPFIADDPEEAPVPLVARAAKALDAFSGGAVDLIVAGHLHRTYSAAFEVVNEETGSAAPSGPQPRLVVIQAGTALSVRRRGEENSFNRIDVRPDGRLEVRRVGFVDGDWRADPEPLATLTRPAPPAARERARPDGPRPSAGARPVSGRAPEQVAGRRTGSLR